VHTPDARLHSAAAERNRAPILDVLARHLPASGTVLELASGSGQHIVHFARYLPQLHWQPSDLDEQCRASIVAWHADAGLGNVRPPLALDARDVPWPVADLVAVLAINLLHISPWPVTEAVFRGAAQSLDPAGIIYLYGPYRIGGRHTAPSNEAFDASLRGRDPDWGVRDRDEVLAVADQHGFALFQQVEMPANNLSLVLRRAST
jgi:SAM-dependent methyltransferase